MGVVGLVRSNAVVLFAMAVAITACDPAPPRSGAPTSPSQTPFVDVPLDSRGPVPSGCYEVVAMPSQDAPSIEHLDDLATSILVGTFDGHDAPRWNTPDGHRPTPSELMETSARLHRPLRITVEQAIRGESEDASHAFDPGGRLDCDLTAIAGGRELTPGGRYVFFFLAVTNSVGATLEDLQLADAWPVGADDVVETPGEGPIALLDLVAAIEQVTPSP
jgi:hypothetical protein